MEILIVVCAVEKKFTIHCVINNYKVQYFRAYKTIFLYYGFTENPNQPGYTWTFS